MVASDHNGWYWRHLLSLVVPKLKTPNPEARPTDPPSRTQAGDMSRTVRSPRLQQGGQPFTSRRTPCRGTWQARRETGNQPHFEWPDSMGGQPKNAWGWWPARRPRAGAAWRCHLEVPANEKQVHRNAPPLLDLPDRGIDLIQRTVAAPLHHHIQVPRAAGRHPARGARLLPPHPATGPLNPLGAIMGNRP